MMNGAVLRTWAHRWPHCWLQMAENMQGTCALICGGTQLIVILKYVELTECLVVSSHVLTLKHKVRHRCITRKWLFQLHQETNRQLFAGHMPLLYAFSAGTWEDTAKHLVSSSIWIARFYCDLQQIGWVLIFLCCFQRLQPAVRSAMSSSSQDRVIHHNKSVEHHIWSKILLLED